MTMSRNLRKVVLSVFRQLFKAPNCVTVPGLRSPGQAEVKGDDFSGADIIHRIGQLQNPPHHEQGRREDFNRIERFLQQVTDHPDAKLEVPWPRDTITVHMDGRSLPLEASAQASTK